MNNTSIKCRDCGGQAPKVTIESHTIPKGSSYGHCTACLAAPECEACGKHAVADEGADIQGEGHKLCAGCRKMLGVRTTKPTIKTNITAPVAPVAPTLPVPQARRVKVSSVAHKLTRKLAARMVG